MSATARFSQIVETCGKPELHVLWGPPEADRDFQRAVKAGRVMTIHQENVGSKKDFGVIGFSQDEPAQFLIFPKSLKPFADRRVVGIKYESLEPPPAPRSAAKNRPAARQEKRSRSIPERPPASAAAKPSVAVRSKSDPAMPTGGPAKTATSSPQSTEEPNPPDSPPPADAASANGSSRDWDRTAVLKEVRAAMKELEAGKAVVVFRRLEKLSQRLGAQESSGVGQKA